MIYPSSAPVEGYVTKGILKRDSEIIHAGVNVAPGNKGSTLPSI